MLLAKLDVRRIGNKQFLEPGRASNMGGCAFDDDSAFRGARAARMLVMASSPSWTFLLKIENRCLRRPSTLLPVAIPKFSRAGGAGKTTFAKEFLPHEVKSLRFYNADEVTRGLSPFDPKAFGAEVSWSFVRELPPKNSKK